MNIETSELKRRMNRLARFCYAGLVELRRSAHCDRCGTLTSMILQEGAAAFTTRIFELARRTAGRRLRAQARTFAAVVFEGARAEGAAMLAAGRGRRRWFRKGV